MSDIRFRPWIGSDYDKKLIDDEKILILGESHYGDRGAEYESFTIDVINEWAIIKRHAFFTKIAKSVLRMPREQYLSDDLRLRFWNSVSFYNFVQEYVGEGPRCRPSCEQWESSKDAFIEVVERLQPDVCVVFGYKLWANLPSPVSEIRSDGFCTYIYDSCDGKRMLAGCVAHPSGGLRYSETHPRIEALIKMAKSD